MGFIKDRFQDEINKEKEILNQLKAEYKEVCQEILASEKEKDRCIDESRGVSPDSVIYRINERAFMAAKNKIILLQNTEASLSKMIDEQEKLILLMMEARRAEKLGKYVNTELIDKYRATLEVYRKKMEKAADDASLASSDAFTEDESLRNRTDSEFRAALAADERRRATMMDAGISESKKDRVGHSSLSEFASLVNGDGNP